MTTILPRKVKTLKEAELRYGRIIEDRWLDETKWMALLDIPERIALGWINSATGRPTHRIYCNKDMFVPLLSALEQVADRGLLHELKTFDGCFLIRKVRGKNAPSTHSYGLALDLNADENGLDCPPRLSRAFVACFTEQGFSWGGNFKRKDGMHFSLAWE